MTEPHAIDVQAIRRRAHELWLRRGCPTGTPELDWQQAEQELRAEFERVEADSAADAGSGDSLPQSTRRRAPRTLVTRAGHAPAARLLAALVPEAQTDRTALPFTRASQRR